MKKLISVIAIGLSVVCYSATTSADINFENKCNVNMEGELSFIKKELTLQTQNNRTVLITAAQDVFVDGKKVVLTATQQNDIKEYYDAIERSIPQVVEVAKEGLQIANYAVGEALTGLLGQGSQAVAMLRDKLTEIEAGLDKHLYQHPEYITFDTRTLEQDVGVSKQWDTQFDALMEEVMPAAMGEFLVAMGRDMMSGNSNGESFEQRMQNIGDDIERNVTAKAAGVEKAAERLCESLKAVDDAEKQVSQISELKELNIVKFNSRA